ncbi:MAG: hypothetical protein U1E76_15005 [Planctomycetota bacterium]
MRPFRILPVVIALVLLAALIWRRPSELPASQARPASSSHRCTLDAQHRSLSLLDDGHADVRFAIMAGRPVLLMTRLGHLIDLGRLAGALPSEHDLEARLPADERAALHASYDSDAPMMLRATMPVAAGHVYVAGAGAMGDGRAEVVALLHITEIHGEATECSLTIERTLLRRREVNDRSQRSIARWAKEERGRATGYARLLPESEFGDPVKASYSLVYGTRDRRDAFLNGFDLRYGREQQLLEVRPWALGQGRSRRWWAARNRGRWRTSCG